MRKGEMTKYEYKEVEVEISIDVIDIINYINSYATDYDLIQIREAIGIGGIFGNRTLDDEYKVKAFINASKHLSSEEIEERLKIKI